DGIRDFHVTGVQTCALPILDFFIVNVSVPSIQRDLASGAAAVQLVLAGYALAYASGLITWGRIGDIHGRRRIFALGTAAFTVARSEERRVGKDWRPRRMSEQ